MAKRKNIPPGKAKAADKGTSTLSLDALGKSWRDKSPILKYLGGFVGLLVIFYAIYTSQFFEEWVLLPLMSLQTAIAGFFLNLFGLGVSSEGAVLQGQAAMLNVAKGCDGMEASALYLIGVLLMPFSWRSKWVGLGLGAGVLFLLNLLRIIVLYLSKVYFPSAFETLHIHGGFALFTIVAILMWAGWANWAMKREVDKG